MAPESIFGRGVLLPKRLDEESQAPLIRSWMFALARAGDIDCVFFSNTRKRIFNAGHSSFLHVINDVTRLFIFFGARDCEISALRAIVPVRHKDERGRTIADVPLRPLFGARARGLCEMRIKCQQPRRMGKIFCPAAFRAPPFISSQSSRRRIQRRPVNPGLTARTQTRAAVKFLFPAHLNV